MPSLTVMMPAFNAKGTIGLAVTSTLRSMPRDSELVVFDDGSTDGTADVVEAIHDPRLRMIRNSANVGGGAARIRLLHETDSNFIASMDADDVCLPWRFVRQRRAVSRADIVFGTAVRFGDGIASLRPSAPLPLSPQQLPFALLFHNPLFHPTFFAKRSVVERASYRPMRVAQDYDLWLRLAASGVTLRQLAVPLIGYRIGEKQVSASSDYASRVKSDPDLRASYLRLARNLFPDLAPTDVETLSEETIKPTQVAALAHLSPVARARYSRILRARATLVPA